MHIQPSTALIRAAAAALLLCGAPALHAAPAGPAGPAGSGNDDRARADLEYARGLAQEWQYVDLAEEVIADLERASLSDALEEELGLVKCDIYAAGARSESDPDRRHELFEKAVGAYEEYIEKNPFAANIPEAERAFVDLSNLWCRSLALQLDDAVGEEREEIVATIERVLTDAAVKAQELITSIESIPDEDRSQLDDRSRFSLMLARAEMLHGIANVIDDGTYYYGQAEGDLEELALEAGETNLYGLRAYIELGRVKASQGKYRDAVDYFEFVQDNLIPRDPEVWDAYKKNEDPVLLDYLFRLASVCLQGLLEATLQSGRTEAACNWGLHYYNLYRAEGFTLHRPEGYLALLAVARTLLDSGGWVGGSTTAGNLKWYETFDEMEADGFTASRNQRSSIDLALSIAQAVNQDNRRNTLQIAAQKLISDVTSRPGVSVAPDVLFEAAQGEYYAKEYPAAIVGMKRILAEIDGADEATRSLFGAKVLHHIGKSYENLDRNLEAAMAYREAVLHWKGDPEYDPKNAQGYYKRISDVRRNAPGDPAIDTLWKEAEQIVVEIGEGDDGEILFRQGKRKWDEGDFSAARDRFLQVETSSNVYEKARVYAAVCHYKNKNYDGAYEELEDYLENRLTDPTATPTNSRQIGYRAEARAMATFYLGNIAFRRARSGQGSYEKVVELFGNYHEEFKEQTSYGPTALYTAILSYLRLDRVEEAKTLAEAMVATYPDSQSTGGATFQIYLVLAAEYKADPSPSVLQQMAEYLSLSNRLSGKRDFANLREESKLWAQLGQWGKAEDVLRSLVQHFSDDPERAEDLTAFVLPDLGEVLLAQQDVHGAHEVLAPLVPDPDDTGGRKATSSTVADYCRSIVGWVEGEGGNIVEVPGIGGRENLEKAAAWSGKLADRVEKWTCEWYGLKFRSAYAYYRLGQEDTAKLVFARTQIQTLRTELGDRFEGKDGVQGIADTCGGDDTLARRFIWLANQLR